MLRVYVYERIRYFVYLNGMFRVARVRHIPTYFTVDASNYGNLGDFEISKFKFKLRLYT